MKTILLTLAVLAFGSYASAQPNAEERIISVPVSPGTVQQETARLHLSATNRIEAGATARYTAGQSVTLQPGFVARAGSVFEAAIRTSADWHEPGTRLTISAFPNPLETTTTVEYQLPEALRVTHRLTDTEGRLIRWVDGQQIESAGRHTSTLDLRNVPVGVYLYQVQTTAGSRTLRLIKH